MSIRRQMKKMEVSQHNKYFFELSEKITTIRGCKAAVGSYIMIEILVAESKLHLFKGREGDDLVEWSLNYLIINTTRESESSLMMIFSKRSDCCRETLCLLEASIKLLLNGEITICSWVKRSLN